MYNPGVKILLFVSFLFIIFACTPRTTSNEAFLKNASIVEKNIEKKDEKQIYKNSFLETEHVVSNDIQINNNIEIILPKNENTIITNNFINSLELSLYKKDLKGLSFNINTYSDVNDLEDIIAKKAQPGKIFVGPLTSNETNKIKKFCSTNVIFFSFASNRSLASDCVYLINFFPQDDLRAIFNFIDSNSRVALLYPEDDYGYYINNIIDKIADDSDSFVVSKSSYKKDLSNARDAIKLLGKYESRRLELERQKKILQNKNDEISIKALKKIEKFETIGELDFTHIIIADHNIRLLEISPLLPFYDIDPKNIQFVGTGLWDDKAFFDEPSLQGAIFPGILKNNRNFFLEDYIKHYKNEPIRTSTIMYDLVGLINYIVENNLSVGSTMNLLNDKSSIFRGIDGQFYFENNLIVRDLNILKIKKGDAILAN